MILFRNDWMTHGSAVIHDNTSNPTWLRMAAVFKRMGVKNYYFHLALHNPLLKNIDPWSNNLSKAEMTMVREECKQNPWYYLREIARVKPMAGMHPVQVKANRGNIALWWLFFNHITVFLMQIRQTGKSVSTDKLLEWVLDYGAVNTTIGLLTKDNDVRVTNIDRIKESRKLVPDYLYAVTRKDSDNQVEVTNKTNKNRIATFVGQKDKIQARQGGRGMTVPIAWNDEGPYTPNVHVTVSAMLGATTAARAEAKAAGAPYGNIFTTTAGDRNTPEGEFIHNLFSGGLKFTEALYDCVDEAELMRRVEMGSIAPSEDVKTLKGVSCVFNHLQLGYSNEWLKETLANVTGTPEEINMDYFNQWGSGGKENPIDRYILSIVVESEKEPVYTQLLENDYTVHWYVKNPYEYIENRHCIIGIDMSEGIGRDAITMLIRDSQSLNVVGTMKVNETNVLRFIQFACQFALMFPNTTIIPERKSVAIVLIDALIIAFHQNQINPFKRIFNTLVNEAEYNETAKTLLKETENCLRWRPEEFDNYKKYFGYVTAGSGEYSRDALYRNTLIESLRMSASVVNDSVLIGELAGLRAKNQRIDHKVKGHDDMVIAFLLTAWLLMYGRNLKYYGISNPLSMVREIGRNDENPEDVYVEKRRNQQLKSQLEAMITQYSHEKDPILKMQLSSRIDLTKGRLTSEEIIGSINDLYEKAKEVRRDRIQSNVSAKRMGSAPRRAPSGFVLR